MGDKHERGEAIRALITAGGTSEPIDDVRVVTNLSSGRFGAAIANALVERGVEVTVLASKNLMGHPQWLNPRVRRVGFGSFIDLSALLEEHTATPPDLLFMAAAVSDYSPVAADGKISSKAEEMVVKMVKNPKLLGSLRERCGEGTYLVGFKLLSGVSPEELVKVARGQISKADLDLTVANDLATFRPGLHPIVLVTPDAAVSHRGSKAEVAHELVAFVLSARGHSLRSDPIHVFEGGLVLPGTATDARSVWAGGDQVGLLKTVECLGRSAHTVWIDPAFRGRGIGDALVRFLGRGRIPVAVHADCEVDDMYLDRGFAIEREDGGIKLLRPPAMRTDLMPAASVCLVDPVRGKVLLGRRTVPELPNQWAFPGGKREEGETPFDCAVRELHEETGLTLPLGDAVLQTTVHLGNGPSAWEIDNFAFVTMHPEQPQQTEELDARWVGLDEALHGLPLASGTALVLRRVLRALGYPP